jgi:hypothetical protein
MVRNIGPGGAQWSRPTNIEEVVPQKVLQFQAPWRLCARLPTRWFSGRFAGMAGAGVSIGAALLPESSLLVRLERRCSHSRKEWWQRSHARCSAPSGWNLASSSSRTSLDECCQQKMPPHFLQWWRRWKNPKGSWHEDAEQTGVVASA